MGLRINRRFGIVPRVRINLGKRGVSASVGAKGAWLTVGAKGVHTSVGVPGTGVYWTEQASWGRMAAGGALRFVVRSLAFMLGAAIGLGLLALFVALA
jgi:hypothetical protein